MAGGGRIKIKGGRRSKGEAVVIDGALEVTVVGGGGAGSFIEHSFRGSATGPVLIVDVMDGLDSGPGLTILREVIADKVGVSIIHSASPDSGTWTLRLFRKEAGPPGLSPAPVFTEVANFTFDT